MSIANELTNLSTNISNAYDAVSAKGGTIPANKNTVNLATAISSISGGGGTIQITNGGIINLKGLSSTVDAYTFVDIANNTTHGTDKYITSSNANYNALSSVALDSSRAFVVWANSSYLYACVTTISGDTFTAGAVTEIGATSMTHSAVAALSSDKVVIFHNGNSNGDLHGIVCTISGTTITPGTDTEISNIQYSSNGVRAIALDQERAFVLHRGASNSTSAIVCTISGTTITPGTDTQISSVTDSYTYARVDLLETDKLFIAYRSGNYTNGMVCTVSNTTITLGTDTRLDSTSSSYTGMGVAALQSDKVFLTYNVGGYLYGKICTISGGAITPQAGEQLSTTGSSSTDVAIGTITANKVLISHRGVNNSAWEILSCYIDGVEIFTDRDVSIGTGINYASNRATVMAFGSNKAMITHRRSSYPGGIVVNVPDFGVVPATSRIKGLTAEECTTSTAGDVWILNS